MPQKTPQKRGPKTPQGLATAAQNARTHGMTSNLPLAPGESQSDRDAHQAQWHLQYPTTNEIAHRLVTRAANSEWHLLRLERQFESIASRLLSQPIEDWSGPDHSLYQNAQRYLTTAQRAHHRDRLNLQQYRAELRTQETYEAARQAGIAKHEPSEPAKESTADILRSLLTNEPAPPSDMPLLQDIHVSLDDHGQPTAILIPTNLQILSNTDKAFETTRITRNVHFKNRHVPLGYEWALDRLASLPPERNTLYLNLTAKSFRLAVERENGGPVQFWPDLDALDKPIFENKLKGPPCQPRESK